MAQRMSSPGHQMIHKMQAASGPSSATPPSAAAPPPVRTVGPSARCAEGLKIARRGDVAGGANETPPSVGEMLVQVRRLNSEYILRPRRMRPETMVQEIINLSRPYVGFKLVLGTNPKLDTNATIASLTEQPGAELDFTALFFDEISEGDHVAVRHDLAVKLCVGKRDSKELQRAYYDQPVHFAQGREGIILELRNDVARPSNDPNAGEGVADALVHFADVSFENWDFADAGEGDADLLHFPGNAWLPLNELDKLKVLGGVASSPNGANETAPSVGETSSCALPEASAVRRRRRNEAYRGQGDQKDTVDNSGSSRVLVTVA